MPYDDDDDQIYDEPPEGMLWLQEPVKFIENFLACNFYKPLRCIRSLRPSSDVKKF